MCWACNNYCFVQCVGWKSTFKHGSFYITHQGGAIFLLLRMFIFKNKYISQKLPYQYHMNIDEYETSNKYYVQLYMYNEEKVKGLTHSSIILQFVIALHFITQLWKYLETFRNAYFKDGFMRINTNVFNGKG